MQLPDCLEHTTESGLQLRLRPVRMVLVELALAAVKDEMRQEGWRVDPPTFTITTAGDEVETLEHVYDPENNINTLVEPNDAKATAVNYARWRQYERGLAELETRQAERRMQEMFKQGVEFDMPHNLNGWEADVAAKSRGQVAVPADEPGNEADRAFYWLWYLNLSQMDVQLVHLKLMVLSQGRIFSEEQFRELQDSVQSQVAHDVWASFEDAFGTTAAGQPRGHTAEAVDSE